jgi:hypothetical protein
VGTEEENELFAAALERVTMLAPGSARA